MSRRSSIRSRMRELEEGSKPREVPVPSGGIPRGKRWGFLGPEGTFSHQALLRYLKANQIPRGKLKLIPYPDIPEIMLDVRSYDEPTEEVYKPPLDAAILAMENVGAGRVAPNYDFVHVNNLHIIGEVVQPLDSALIGHRRQKKIGVIHSHPAALASAQPLITAMSHHQDQIIRQRASKSTSAALETLLASTDRTEAAICSEAAFNQVEPDQKKHLKVVRRHFSLAGKANYTTFYIVAHEEFIAPLEHPNVYHTFLVFTPYENRPGFINAITQPFTDENVNIVDFFTSNNLQQRDKIEARIKRQQRPLIPKRFYMVVEGHIEEMPVYKALEKVEGILRSLGYYADCTHRGTYLVYNPFINK